jgi:hypothetical protein
MVFNSLYCCIGFPSNLYGPPITNLKLQNAYDQWILRYAGMLMHLLRQPPYVISVYIPLHIDSRCYVGEWISVCCH